MLTLWGRPNSINVQKVLWTLDELGLPFEHIDAGGDAGGLDEPAFRAMNPHGRVPVLRDGDAAIWESNTIVRYLCATYGDAQLCPPGPAERAACDAWMDWTATTLQPAVMELFWRFYRMPAAQRNESRNRELELASAAAVRSLDACLKQRSFVAAETFTMADIPAGTMMFRYFEMGVATPQTPAVAAWRGRLAERIPYRTHVMRPFGELFGRLAH